MGLTERLRRLDNRVLGTPGPLAPDVVVPDLVARNGALRRNFAYDDQHAARRAPDPRGVVISGGLMLVTQAITVTLYSFIGIDRASWFYFPVAAVWLLLMATGIIRSVHSYRTAVIRADAIYGPDWRQLSRADRALRWRNYCAQWWAWFYAHTPPPAPYIAQPPPFRAPARFDPSNPYAAPR